MGDFHHQIVSSSAISKHESKASTVVGSHQVNVTVNGQDQVTQPAMVTTPIQPRPGHVIITPLANAMSMTIPSISQRNSSHFCQQTTPALGAGQSLQSMGHMGLSLKLTEFIISKLLLKGVCKSSSRTFTLCDVDIASVNSRGQLKKS